jgi:hypothetical protein
MPSRSRRDIAVRRSVADLLPSPHPYTTLIVAELVSARARSDSPPSGDPCPAPSSSAPQPTPRRGRFHIDPVLPRLRRRRSPSPWGCLTRERCTVARRVSARAPAIPACTTIRRGGPVCPPGPQGTPPPGGPYTPSNEYGAFSRAQCVRYMWHVRNSRADVVSSRMFSTATSPGEDPPMPHPLHTLTTPKDSTSTSPSCLGPGINHVKQVRTPPRTYLSYRDRNPCNHAEIADEVIKWWPITTNRP